MITTTDWIAQRFDHMDVEDLNSLEREIVDRLIDEGYLTVEPVRDALLGTLNDGDDVIFNELVYQTRSSVPI